MPIIYYNDFWKTIESKNWRNSYLVGTDRQGNITLVPKEYFIRKF